ncbi:MAG: hypothetical protein QOG59_2822, partial [Solirubrobacteraceae bacterium]|nr:hypothetical protein [Solirubrobacteraceae bacterium]
MRPITPKSFSMFLAVAAALGVGACGNKTSSIHNAETEGIYLNVGPLKYQVEISRQLNPRAIPEDKTFVQGIDPAQATLAPDELWFAVFVRVENETHQAQIPASFFQITDTEGTVYRPVDINDQNPFYFNTSPIRAQGVAPDPDSVAGQLGSIGGMELLFKVKRTSLDNRPLVLTIKSIS